MGPIPTPKNIVITIIIVIIIIIIIIHPCKTLYIDFQTAIFGYGRLASEAFNHGPLCW